jgi:Flp pilus assembly protein TadG
MRGSVKRLRGEDGVAAVEFAVVLTVLFLIVFGVIEFGLAISRIQVFENAARTGARNAAVAASTNESVGAVKQDVVDAANGYVITDGVKAGTAAITVSQAGVPLVNGTPCLLVTTGQNIQLKVSWTQRINIDIPFWKSATIDRPISATFRCEPKAT